MQGTELGIESWKWTCNATYQIWYTGLSKIKIPNKQLTNN